MADKKQKIPPKQKKVKDSERKHLFSWAVFVSTFVIVFITLIPVVYPALIARATSPFTSDVYQPNIVNPFVPGVLAGPLVAVNLAVLGIGVLFYKRKIGSEKSKLLEGFELSKKQALISILVILGIFCALTVKTLGEEEQWADYHSIKQVAETWSPSYFLTSFEPHVKYLFLSISLHDLGNIRILPFIMSIALLLQTYFFTKKITGKRFAGIVSMSLVLQSNIFVTYSTTAAYDNSWILLYLFSLYLTQKFWPASPASFLLSTYAKALTIAFLPITLYFIARSLLTRRTKIYSLVVYGVIIAIIVSAAVIYGPKFTAGQVKFDSSPFWQGFGAMAIQMRFDYIVILFLLPLTVMLFFKSRKGILHADSVLVFFLITLISTPFLSGFTTQTNEPYRFVPLVVFFAIGVGILFSNKTREQVELSSSK